VLNLDFSVAVRPASTTPAHLVPVTAEVLKGVG